MKGISFIQPLFHATLEGRKTKTRRIMKPHPIQQIFEYCPLCGEFFDDADFDFQICHICGFNGNDDENLEYSKPHYRVGETVFLREPYKIERLMYNAYFQLKYSGFSGHIDHIKNKIPHFYRWIEKRLIEQKKSKSGWCNKLFIPACVAHYRIEITDVRCERLQDISDEDCFAEGIIKTRGALKQFVAQTVKGDIFRDTPQKAFAALIDSINGKNSWDKNPWVWVYTYKLTK